MDKNNPSLIQDDNPDRYVVIDADGARMELGFRTVDPEDLERYGPTA